MDYSSHYQQQQSTDPSAQQIQNYEQSAAQSYYPYPYDQYNPNVQQPYPYYDYGVQPQQQEEQQQQQQQQEPKPPGVSDPSQQAQNQYYQYYQQAPAINADYTGYAAQQQQGGVSADYAGYAAQQHQVYPWGGVNADGSGLAVPQQPIPPSYGGPGRMDGVPSQGAARGHFGHKPNVPGRPFGGRGRGRGRALNLPPKRAYTQPNFGSGPMPQARPAAPIAPAQPKVFPCELCKVECNTLDVLEKHKTGKKHLKNLKNYQDSQRREVPPPQPVNQEITETGVLKRKAEEAGLEPNQESENGPGLGPKPKKKSKKKKPLDSKKKTDPSKPKEVVPLVCELCNVKCDTPAVFQIHLVGKKHLLKAKRFLSQNEILGQEVLKALALFQQNPYASTSVAPGPGFIPGLNGSGANPEAINQNFPISENPESGYLVNDEGALNEKPLEFAGTEVVTCGKELDGVSVFQPSVGVPSSGEVALTGSDDKIEPVESKGEEPSAQ